MNKFKLTILSLFIIFTLLSVGFSLYLLTKINFIYAILVGIFFLPSIAFLLVFHQFYYNYCVLRSKDYALPKIKKYSKPLVSIIIPTYNEPVEMIAEAIDSLKNMDYPKLEIIVVDDSEKEQAEKLKDLCKHKKVKFLHRKKRIAFHAGALRYAAKRAKGEIMGTIDVDYKVNRDWLNKTVPFFQLKGVDVVESPQGYRSVKTSIGRVAGAFREATVIVNMARWLDGGLTFSSPMMLAKKNVFEKFFGTKYLTEDFAFGIRMVINHRKVVYYRYHRGKGLSPKRTVDFAKQQARWTDDLRIFKDLYDGISKLSVKKRMHLFYYSTKGLYHVPLLNILILAFLTSILNVKLAVLLLLTYLFITANKFVFCKFYSKNLKWRDVVTFMSISYICYPYLIEELIKIFTEAKMTYFRSPKV